MGMCICPYISPLQHTISLSWDMTHSVPLLPGVDTDVEDSLPHRAGTWAYRMTQQHRTPHPLNTEDTQNPGTGCRNRLYSEQGSPEDILPDRAGLN